MYFFSIVCSCDFHIVFVVASVDSTMQTAQQNGVDWQEEIYQKVLSCFSFYFYILTEVLQGKKKLIKQIIKLFFSK